MTDIREKCDTLWDLIVVGAGMTGVAAAITAKREGLNVLLIEKAGFAGGAAATCLVNPYMPFQTRLNGERIDLSAGFFTEMRQSINRLAGVDDNCMELHEEYVKIALDRLLRREGVCVLYHAYLADACTENGKIQSVRVATKAGILTFRARMFIDATGDADLAVLAGCPFRLGRGDGLCQPMTLCFRIGNCDIPTVMKNHALMQEKYREFQRAGKIKNPRENVLLFYTHIDGMLHFNTTRIVKHDPTNPFDVTNAEMDAREQMLEMYLFLKENVPGFENSRLLYSAGEIGVRESRMIDGEYVITEDDMKSLRKFDDAIAACNYDIDIHNPEGSGTSHYYFKPGTWYTIPYRCLIPRGTDNLWVAGRCISCTHEAQASLRIMPTVTTLGEAAGAAAAVAFKQGVSAKNADISHIQCILKANGAFIGN